MNLMPLKPKRLVNFSWICGIVRIAIILLLLNVNVYLRLV